MSKSFSLGSGRLGFKDPASEELCNGGTTALREGLGLKAVQL